MQGTGSGIVLNENRILTNAHVLVGRAPEVESWDGEIRKVRVVRQERRRDLALLVADRLSAPAAILSSEIPRSGTPVIAAGNPLGFVGAISTGTVYQVGPVRGLGHGRWVQSNLRLAPGNSGGPLADIHGQIIGVNTMIAGPLALAIPAEAVQAFLSAESSRTLGVTVRPIGVRAGNAQPRFGLILLELEPGGAAERASLLPGDILVSTSGKRLRSPDDLYDAINTADLLTLGFLRGDSAQERRVTVQLTALPAVDAA
jgi:serine protease Do